METASYRKTKKWRVSVILLCLLTYSGCGGGGGSSGDSSDSLRVTSPSGWLQTDIRSVDAGGLLTANLKVITDETDRMHVVHYAKDGDAYAIEYGSWDLSFRQLEVLEATRVVATVDNSATLGFALDNAGTPIVVYQGGEFRECGAEQSDVMINLTENGSWSEYLGAMGFVHRNPVLTDGLAGADADVAVDSSGAIHICYQFSYEGCDAMNHQYPDLRYVKRERGLLGNEASISEETIEGSLFPAFDYGIQNSVGYHCRLLLDEIERPMVFYAVAADQTDFGDQTAGLRMARRSEGDTWQLDWVEEDCEVVAISAARSAVTGTLAVAYAVKENNGVSTVYFLKFAQLINDAWLVETVDDSVSCGSYCSLAFDSNGQPAVAYYEIRSHTGRHLQNLKFAQMTGGTWQTEPVAQSGDIGKYNNLWFDGNNCAHITTYSESKDEVILFQRGQGS